MEDAAASPGPQQQQKTFKERTTFENRVDEVASIRAKFHRKVPVIVERHKQERDLPLLDRTKFLVPEDLSMCQFFMIVRNRMQLQHHQTLFLLINNKSLAGMSAQMSEIYKQDKDKDGFLYVIYASQPVFG